MAIVHAVVILATPSAWHCNFFSDQSYGVFTLAWSGTGTGTGTRTCIMQNLSHCTGTWKNGLYGFNKNLSHCTWTGTGKNTSIHHRAHFQDLKNGYHTHSSGPENIPGVLPCPCLGAVWKVLIKTIQSILPGPGPCPGPASGPSQCEYTIKQKKHGLNNPKIEHKIPNYGWTVLPFFVVKLLIVLEFLIIYSYLQLKVTWKCTLINVLISMYYTYM